MANGNTVVDSFTTETQINSYLNTLTKKYLANTEFILSSSGTAYLTASDDAIAPYANLTNRYFPTVATLPDESTNLKTKGQLGGYFLPQNIGASVYLTKNITYKLNQESIQPGVTYKFIQPAVYNKGRGLTLTDQDNIITHVVDNTWMKSIHSSPAFDGSLINTSIYQKFIPYQSKYETIQDSSNGVVNPRNDFEFWTGPQKNTWNANTKTFQLTEEKYFDLAGRIDSLVLTDGKELYTWNTDVFGNQYGLYKLLQAPTNLYNSTTAVGTLWVKTLDGTATIAPSALNNIYNKYRNSNIYYQLTGNNIINAEVFFDTIVLQLSSTVLYEKINFNYETYEIESALQSFLPLTYTPQMYIEGNQTLSTALSTRSFFKTYNAVPGTSAVTFYGGNWYNSKDKIITLCTLLSSTISANSLSVFGPGVSSLIVPVLYNLDLNKTENRVRIFPTETTSFIEYVYPLKNGRGVSYIEPPVFTFNEDTKTYLTTFITFSGDDSNTATYGPAEQKVFLASYKVKI